jgi:hypothetical protein
VLASRAAGAARFDIAHQCSSVAGHFDIEIDGIAAVL